MTGVLAIMVFLTVLAAALGLATAHARAQLADQLAGRMTIQLPGTDPDDRLADALAARLQAMREVLKATPVDRAAVVRLLQPWLGSDVDDPDLPVPALIDVDLVRGDATSVARVEHTLRRLSPTARADRHADWMSPIGHFMASVTALAGVLVLLMVAATAATVLLTVRAGLQTHSATIEIMHMLGSTDVQIARLFQRRIGRDAALGGLIGAAAALSVAALLGVQITALGSDLLNSVSLHLVDWALLASLPMIFLSFAVVVARLTVLASLRRTL